jgi:hypothetical protein
MAKAKEGYHRICCDVEEDWIKAIKTYNKTATRQINMSAVMKKAIKAEVDAIKTEVSE